MTSFWIDNFQDPGPRISFFSRFPPHQLISLQFPFGNQPGSSKSRQFSIKSSDNQLVSGPHAFEPPEAPSFQQVSWKYGGDIRKKTRKKEKDLNKKTDTKEKTHIKKRKKERPPGDPGPSHLGSIFFLEARATGAGR